MYWRFITLMCALSPSPTEAHAGTLLFLRSDGPLYNCTRATALWALLWGAPELPKGNVHHCHNHHNLELRRRLRRAWLNPARRALRLSISAVTHFVLFCFVFSKRLLQFSDQVIILVSLHRVHLFSLSMLQPLLRTTFTHVT